MAPTLSNPKNNAGLPDCPGLINRTGQLNNNKTDPKRCLLCRWWDRLKTPCLCAIDPKLPERPSLIKPKTQEIRYPVGAQKADKAKIIQIMVFRRDC